MIPFDCAHCGKKLKVKEELTGKRVKCPACARPTPVPQTATMPSTSSTPPVADPELAIATVLELGPKQVEQESVSGIDGPTVVAGKFARAANAFSVGDAALSWDFLAPAQLPDEIGRLGPYRVLSVLGTGGMGIVFRAEDPSLGRPIAIKAMLPEIARKPVAKERFFREARAAANLKHPNIVTIHQVGEDRGAPFLAMEFLEGESLDHRLRNTPLLPLTEILRIGREIALGLEAAHKKGLIHRDIKPANIWLEGEVGHVKILDFGLARAMGETAQLTQSGTIVGTPAFMAPEQATAGKPVDHRSDLFSLGCVLYRMTTGEMPFKGDDTLTILSSLANFEPPPPASVSPGTPLQLSNLIVKLLAKNPKWRPESARAIVDRIREIEREVAHDSRTDTKPPSVFRPQAKAASGSGRALWALAALTFLTAIGVGGYVGYRSFFGNRIATTDEPRSGPEPKIASTPLDGLEAARIPPHEREPWHPIELVSVIGTRHMRHWSLPDAFAFSHDGKTLASGCGPGENRPYLDGVRVWDTKGLREKFHLKGAGIPLGFSLNDTALLTFSPTAGVRIWDCAGEPKVQRIITNSDAKTRWVAAVMSPDARMIAILTSNRTIALIELNRPSIENTARPFATLTGFDGIVGDFVFSADGARLAVSDESKVRLWSLTESEPKEQAAIISPDRVALAFSPDGKSLAVGSFENAELWDVGGLMPKHLSEIAKGRFYNLSFTPDGRRLASNDHGYIKFTELSKASAKKAPLGWSYQVSAPRVSHDGSLLAFGADNLVRLFDVSQPTPIERTSPGSEYLAAEFTPDHKHLICRTSAETEIWTIAEGAPKRHASIKLSGNDTLGPLAISGDGALVLNQQKAASRLWKLTAGEPELLAELPFTGLGWARPVFARKGRLLACGNERGIVELWDFADDRSRKIAEFAGHEKAIDRTFFARDGKTLGCFSSDANSIQFWDIEGAQAKPGLLFEPPQGLLLVSADLSPDGRTLATHLKLPGGGEQLWLWSISDKGVKQRGILPSDGDIPYIPFDAFSADGSKIVTKTLGGTSVAVWNALTGVPLRKWTFPGQVHWCSFAADSRHLAIANQNNTVFVVRLEGDLQSR